jgi:hypothetical protein
MKKNNLIESSKIENILANECKVLENPIFLEFGVQLGSSTSAFLNICKKNNGFLYSVDIDDCSDAFKNINYWKFIQSRDDNFKKIKDLIPKKIDLIYLDTEHTANHVEKIIYNYFDLLKTGGLFIIDDTSWIPYLKNNNFNNFFCEINNKETFDRILEIYNGNVENIDIKFSFEGSGSCIIKKKNNQNLNVKKRVVTRENSLKNMIKKFLNILS